MSRFPIASPCLALPLLAGALLQAACRSSLLPTSPTGAAAATIAPGGTLTVTQLTFMADCDSPVQGSEALLTALDGNQLTFITTKGTVIATFEPDTVFGRRSSIAIVPSILVGSSRLTTIWAGRPRTATRCFWPSATWQASCCLARVLVEKTVPPNPVRSFRPLPSF